VLEKIEFLTQELLKKTRDIKHGNVSINLNIHNGRITTITNTTTLSVKDYLNEELGSQNNIETQNYKEETIKNNSYCLRLRKKRP